MSLGELWSRTLVYFGIAEEDEDSRTTRRRTAAEETLEQSYRERPNVRRLTPAPARRRASTTGPSPRGRPAERARRSRAARPAAGAAQPPARAIEAVPNPSSVRVHLVLPRSFNDAQQIADKFKHAIPVILNLQNADNELSKRLIDFASGLTYALERRHAARRRQGVPAHAAKRRGERRAARAAARTRRLLQPGLRPRRVQACRRRVT